MLKKIVEIASEEFVNSLNSATEQSKPGVLFVGSPSSISLLNISHN